MGKLFTTGLIFSAILVFCISLPQKTIAQEGNLGLGVAIGDYTGFNYKYWFTPDYAISGNFTGTIRSGNSQLLAHWDLLVHRHNLIEVEAGSIPVFYGFGFFAQFNQNFRNNAGLRIPAGIEYILDNQKLGIFVEAAPIIQITNNESVTFSGAIGFRFYL